jgi:hypothetical protein
MDANALCIHLSASSVVKMASTDTDAVFFYATVCSVSFCPVGANNGEVGLAKYMKLECLHCWGKRARPPLGATPRKLTAQGDQWSPPLLLDQNLTSSQDYFANPHVFLLYNMQAAAV